jgi:uncharacterized repeat protein (TIGR01451 family)
MSVRRRSTVGSLALLCILVLVTALPLPPAAAQVPQVAYVYDDDTVSRDSFVSTIEARGLDVVPLDLAAAATQGDSFANYLAVIIADDTGRPPSEEIAEDELWEGGSDTASTIRANARKVITIGYGAQFFDMAGGYNLGWLPSAPPAGGPTADPSESSVFAVEPGAAYWSTPNLVPLPADNIAKLYGLVTPVVALNTPPARTVIPIGRAPNPQGDYPLAAELSFPQQQPICNIQWGFRRAPNAMTPAGRDLLENLIRQDPCEGQASEADLGITKSDSPDPATVGQNLTYTLTASNGGPAPASNVRVEDTLPENATFVSATPSAGSCVRHGRTVKCNLGTLASGASATVTIVVKPNEAVATTNTAFVTSDAPDPNGANNSATATTTVNQPPSFQPILALPYRPLIITTIPLLPTEDLSVHGIEITQGIQCFDQSVGLTDCSNNSLPQVTRKSTTARIYLRYSGPSSGKNNVPVRLVITDANNVQQSVNVTGRALPTISRGSAADSGNVFFVVNFNNATAVRFHAIVDPNNVLAETNEGNNRFPASGDVTISFSPRRTMKVVSQRLDYHPSGYSGTRQSGGWAVNGGATQWIEQLLPIRNGGISHQVKSGYLDWTTNLTNGDNQHALIINLNTRWLMENVFSWLFGSGAFTGARHVYGWIPGGAGTFGHADMPVYPHAGGLGVVAIGTDNPGTSTDNPGAGTLIFGHEVVHDYDVKHTDVPGDCGSSDSSTDFPYSTASIQEFGFNTITGKVYNPNNTHDLMSYCPSGGSQQGWISPFTWSRMYNKLAPSSPSAADASTQAIGPALIVNATIRNPALPAGLPATGFGTLYRVEADVPTDPPPAGNYAVVLRDASDTEIGRTPFVVSFESEYGGSGAAGHSHAPGTGFHTHQVGDPNPTPAALISLAVPWVDGTAKIELVGGTTVLDTRVVSANPPVVTITSPATAVSWPSATNQTISWSATDPDGGELRYSVFYAHDGVSWQLLAQDLDATSYTVAVDSLAGGAGAKFRVVASDGVNIGEDETTAPISVPDKRPEPIITNPEDGSDVPPGDLLVLEGFAGDLEDGVIPDAALSWSSDRDGALGNGSSLPVSTLQPGEHTITLTATDAGGQSNSTTVTIYVGDRVFLPTTTR